MLYSLYNDDVLTGRFEVSRGTVVRFEALNASLLPKQLLGASADGFSLWLQARSIDLNTFQHRRLAQELTGSRDKISIALATHMFSISDTFTCFAGEEFTPRNQLCKTDDQNTISDFILVSSDTSLRKAGTVTPNASTDGSFTKTWRWQDGEWWLYKLQSTAATRSEYEISKALIMAGFDAAEYRYDGNSRTRIRTRNFVGEHEFFEPYESLRYMFEDRSDNEDAVSENIASLGSEFAQRWQDILLADALFKNTDRHMRNFGVIRSSITGEILRLAPNFDNNQAYLANPGGNYSDVMLRMYMTKYGMDDRIHARLELLVTASEKSAYLNEATNAGKAFLQNRKT